MALGLTMVALLVVWRLLPVDQWLLAVQDRVARLGALGAVVFALVYVGAVLLFVPGSVLTVGAGLVFGVVRGTVIVSLASTTAAAAAFLIARHVARDRVEKVVRRYEKFGAIDRAIRQQGFKVVALLRLSPLVPFSISNYLYGLTAVDFRPYVLASWLGMLPGTVLYVSLGAAGAAVVGRGGERGPWGWTLLAAGLLATVVVTVLLTRAARRELAKNDVAGRASGERREMGKGEEG
jgi:uncharacterized membrane protein YdjX (TVP38/TMEM64 family)